MYNHNFTTLHESPRANTHFPAATARSSLIVCLRATVHRLTRSQPPREPAAPPSAGATPCRPLLPIPMCRRQLDTHFQSCDRRPDGACGRRPRSCTTPDHAHLDGTRTLRALDHRPAPRRWEELLMQQRFGIQYPPRKRRPPALVPRTVNTANSASSDTLLQASQTSDSTAHPLSSSFTDPPLAPIEPQQAA